MGGAGPAGCLQGGRAQYSFWGPNFPQSCAPCERLDPSQDYSQSKIAARDDYAASLRAKGTLISEPRFSTPCEMRFFPCEKGKMAFVEGFSLKRPFSLSRVGKIASRRGEKIGGSLVSVPLALRVHADHLKTHVSSSELVV